MKTLFAIVAIATLSIPTIHFASGQEEASEMAEARSALVGVWVESQSDVPRIPKLQITEADDEMEIRFWGRGSEDENVDGLGEQLRLLSRYEGSKVENQETALAFATIKADYGVMHFTLRIHDDVLHLEGVKIVDDERRGGNRLVTATYTKDGKVAPEKSVAKNDAGNEAMKDDDETKDASVKRGTIAGRVESGSTLRGRLTLTPTDPKIQPTDGIQVGSANPRFQFTDVPEGEYKLTFNGTVNGVTKQMVWDGLKVDVDGEAEPKSLSVKLR